MFRHLRLALPLLPLAVSACAAGERGLVSPHQPLVGATAAAVPGCPDWKDRAWPASEGQGSNYGCATAMNLAAMIADPADLIHGKRGDGAGTGELAVRAIKTMNSTAGSGKQGLEKISSKAGG